MHKDLSNIVFNTSLKIIVQRYKLLLFFGSLFLIISLSYNQLKKYELYEDTYNLYFHDKIYLIQKDLRDELLNDALNIPEGENFDVSKNFNLQTITISSQIKNLDKIEAITNHSNMIFSGLISLGDIENSIKSIKKSSKKITKIKNKTSPYFFFLMGFIISFLVLIIQGLNKYFEDKK